MSSMQLVGSLLGFFGNLIAGWILARPWPWIRLDVEEEAGPLFSFGSTTLAISVSPSYSAVIRVHNAGRVQFTVNRAGWLTGDGESYPADLPADRTLEPGGPEMRATASADKLLAFTREHRGLSGVYLHLAGADKPRRHRISNEWRALLRGTEGAARRTDSAT
jgi:hypothetical protein